MAGRRLQVLLVGGFVAVVGILLLVRAVLHEQLAAPSPPPPEEFTVPPVVSDSTIFVTAKVSLAAVERLANSKIPDSFRGREGDPTDALYDDSASWRVSRGPLSIAASDGALRLVAPIIDGKGTVEGRFGARGDIGRLVGSTQVSATVDDIRGRVTARLAPTFRTNWTIDPNANVDLDLSNAELRVRHVGTVSMRGFLERQFADERRKLVAKLTDFLTETNVLRDSMKETWNNAFVVEKLGDEAAWLLVKPTSVLAAPLKAEGDYLKLVFGMTAQGQVVFQDAAPENPPTPLPSLTIVEEPKPDLELNLPVAIEYGAASAAIRRHLSEQEFNVGGTKVGVDDVSVRSSGNRLRIDANVTGRSGWFRRTTVSVTLFGRPHIDVANKALSVADLEYDVETRNYLLQAASWALDPILLRELQEASVVDLVEVEGQLVDEAKKQIEQAKSQLPPGVSADVDLSRITLNDVRVTPESLFLVLQTGGAVRVQLDEIPIE